MQPSFNLIDQPWIPCLREDGTIEELSILDCLTRAHTISSINCDSPLEFAAIHRLLLAILHRVFGPSSHAEWYKLWKNNKFDALILKKYFKEFHQRFDLFDPDKPFYQLRDDRVLPKSIINLVAEMSSGNNATLFDHHIEADRVILQPSQSARSLCAALLFGLGGLSGISQKFTDSPWARGVIFMCEGHCLFQTLMLNLITYPDESYFPPHTPQDKPAWEMEDPLQPERRIPIGYLDYLTWHSQRILLFPEEVTQSWVVSKISRGPALRLDESMQSLDPMKHYYKDEKKGIRFYRFIEGKAVWRDSPALFSFSSPSTNPPVVFRHLHDLLAYDYLDRKDMMQFIAIGMANDQAKIEFTRLERFPLPLIYIEDEQLVGKLDHAIQIANDINRILYVAIHQFANEIISSSSHSANKAVSSKDANNLVSHLGMDYVYWSNLELHFHQLLVTLPTQPEAAISDWSGKVRKIAHQALDHAIQLQGEGLNALKASALAREELTGNLARIFSDQKEQTS